VGRRFESQLEEKGRTFPLLALTLRPSVLCDVNNIPYLYPYPGGGVEAGAEEAKPHRVGHQDHAPREVLPPGHPVVYLC
jgi:hypothetical protein